MAPFEEIAPEFAEPNTVACTTFLFDEQTYTVSTCRLSGAPNYFLCRMITIAGDRANNNEHLTNKDYETLLFLNGEPAPYPFGDMFGNETQGIFERYDTEDEACSGHQDFVARVKQVLRGDKS